MEVKLSRPSASFKGVLCTLNPIDFFNPRHIPMESIRPSSKDYQVCLRVNINISPAQLYVAAVLDSRHTAMVPIEETSVDYIRLFADACDSLSGGDVENGADQRILTYLTHLFDQVRHRLAT